MLSLFAAMVSMSGVVGANRHAFEVMKVFVDPSAHRKAFFYQ